MVRIQDHLAVATSQHNGALQLTALSSGFDVVTLGADLAESSNVELRVAQTASSSTVVSDALHIECSVYPFERKALAQVHKVPGKHAFVRVNYELKSVCALAVDEIQQAQWDRERAILDATKRAQDAYYTNPISAHLSMDTTAQWIAQRRCGDLARFFAAHWDSEVHFVDSGFPPIFSSLVGVGDDSGGDQVQTTHDGAQRGPDSDEADAALYSLAAWVHLHDVLDDSWRFAALDKPPPPHRSQRHEQRPSQLPPLTQLRSVLPGQDSLLCALAFLALDKHTWLQQIITTKELLAPCSRDAVAAMRGLTAVGVQLCERGVRWRQVVVDLFVPVFPVGVGLLAACAPVTGELYPTVLQKALAKLKGSYKAVGATPTIALLRELTGVPWMSIYRPSGKQAQQQLYAVVVTQAALQRLISRRHHHRYSKRRERKSGRHVFVASFEAVGGHHYAFPVLTGDEEQGIALQDVNSAVARALGRPVKAELGPSNAAVYDDDEDLAVRCSWHEFFQLKPNVWMALANHREAVRKRILFVRPSSSPDSPPTRFQFAFSLVEMTSVAIVTQLDEASRGASGGYHQCSLALDAVGNDFALTRIAREDGSSSAGDTSNELQLVLALGAGEYVLSIEVASHDDPSRLDDAAHSETRTSSSCRSLTSGRDPERNLQLLFDCLDQDMDGALSLVELQTFLDTHESPEAAANTRVLAAFMQRFGSFALDPDDSVESLAKPAVSARAQLVLSDLRDVYQFLASTCEQGATRGVEQRRYEELIWDDLVVLLLPRDAAAGYSAIRETDVSELRCCVRADAPLVSFMQFRSPLAA